MDARVPQAHQIQQKHTVCLGVFYSQPHLERDNAPQWVRTKHNSRDSSVKEKQAHTSMAPVYSRSKTGAALTVRLANINQIQEYLLQLVQLHKYADIFSERLYMKRRRTVHP